jgi:hypothetical protein
LQGKIQAAEAAFPPSGQPGHRSPKAT